MFFVALCCDFMDRRNGSFLRRCLYIVCLLINTSFMMRIESQHNGDLMIWWFVGSVVILLSKVLQLKGKARRVDEKLRGFVDGITPNGKQRTAHR